MLAFHRHFEGADPPMLIKVKGPRLGGESVKDLEEWGGGV